MEVIVVVNVIIVNFDGDYGDVIFVEGWGEWFEGVVVVLDDYDVEGFVVEFVLGDVLIVIVGCCVGVIFKYVVGYVDGEDVFVKCFIIVSV